MHTGAARAGGPRPTCRVGIEIFDGEGLAQYGEAERAQLTVVRGGEGDVAGHEDDMLSSPRPMILHPTEKIEAAFPT